MDSEKILTVQMRAFMDQRPEAWGCKDLNSKYLHANIHAGKLTGVKHHLDLVGMTDYDLPYGLSKFAKLFRAQDQQVIATGKNLSILNIHRFSGNQWKAYVYKKSPLMGDDGKTIVGTVFRGEEITATPILDLDLMLGKVDDQQNSEILGQNSYLLSCNSRNLSLTRRQSEALFFLIRGKTCLQIATILQLSVRTVEDHLYTLKCKFVVENKYELIDRAIAHGYLNVIPPSLLNREISLALN